MNEQILSIFPLRERRQIRRAAGFTLVELLAVIGIIVILIGLLFAAMKFARNSSAQARTKVQLDTLRGMLTELDSANSLSQSPPVWVWYDISPFPQNTGAAPFPLVSGSGFSTYVANSWTINSVTYVADFWRYPFSLVNNTTVQRWDALDSPGDVGNDGDPQQTIQRNASCAILNTQLAMQLLGSVAANKTAIAQLPANSVTMPLWTAGVPLQATLATNSPYVGLLKEQGQDSPMATAPGYVSGMHVTYGGRDYVCVVPQTTATPVPNGTTPWYDETAQPRGIPILLDGWGNPIIYVPATGLHVKLLNGQNSYLTSDPPHPSATQEWIIISPEGVVSGNGTSNPIVTHPGRPFFASAGPDGDFTKGDDNLYSFND